MISGSIGVSPVRTGEALMRANPGTNQAAWD